MRQRKRDFVVDMVFGTFSSVAFAYVLQQQVDPKGKCPGVDRAPCWTMVGVYACNAVLGAIYIPYVVVRIVKISGRWSRGGETVKRLSTFATTTATVCFSISVSTTLSQLLGELEYVATSGEVSNSGSGPHVGRNAGPGHTYRHYGDKHRDGRDYNHRDDRRHEARRMLGSSSDDPDVTIHQMGQVILAKIVTCVVGLFVFTLIMFEANRCIKRATRPLAVEMCMLLRSSLHYASAFCVSTILTCLWFFPIDAISATTGDGLKHVRLFWSVCKAWLYFRASRHLARRLDWPPEDESQIILILADSWKCLAALWHKTLAVVACLGIFDTVDFFISDYLPLNSQQQTFAYFIYAFSVLIFATARRGGLILLKHEQTTSSGPKPPSRGCCCFPNGRRSTDAVVSATSQSLQWQRSDEAFYDTTESWIVSFAFWVPFKSTLIQAYDLSSSVSSSRHLNSVERHLVRLIWQLFLGAAIVALCALLTVALLSLQHCSTCCSKTRREDATATSSSTARNGEEYFVVVDNDSTLSNPLIPDARAVPYDDADSSDQQRASLARGDGGDAYYKKLPPGPEAQIMPL